LKTPVLSYQRLGGKVVAEDTLVNQPIKSVQPSIGPINGSVPSNALQNAASIDFDLSYTGVDVAQKLWAQFRITNGGLAPITLVPGFHLWTSIDIIANNSTIIDRLYPDRLYFELLLLNTTEQLGSTAALAGFNPTTFVSNMVIANGASFDVYFPLNSIIEKCSIPLCHPGMKITVRFNTGISTRAQVAGTVGDFNLCTMSNFRLITDGFKFVKDSDRAAWLSVFNSAPLLIRYLSSQEYRQYPASFTAGSESRFNLNLSGGVAGFFITATTGASRTGATLVNSFLDITNLDVLDQTNNSIFGIVQGLQASSPSGLIFRRLIAPKDFANATVTDQLFVYPAMISADPMKDLTDNSNHGYYVLSGQEQIAITPVATTATAQLNVVPLTINEYTLDFVKGTVSIRRVD
jgi:hypothetical protein